MGQDGNGAAGKVFDENLLRINAQMVVDRGQEIAGPGNAINRVLATLVTGTDDTTGLDTAACPEIGEGTGPMIAPRLNGPGRAARDASPGAGNL